MTRTIATEAVSQAEPPRWRLSLADIEGDGPFSRFDGYDRTIVSIDGPPAVLDIDGVGTPLVPHWPLRFAGEAAVSIAIAGATRDVNVMVRRDAARAAVWVERTESAVLRTAPGILQFAFVLHGHLNIDRPGPDSTLGRFDCLQLEQGTSCEATGPALLLRIEISPNR